MPKKPVAAPVGKSQNPPAIPDGMNLAQNIIAISKAMTDLQASGVNQRAIIVLLQDATKLTQAAIKTVLDELPRLRDRYCTPGGLPRTRRKRRK